MSLDFETLLPLALFALGKFGGSSPVPATTQPTGFAAANEVPRVRTGGDDRNAWARSRYGELVRQIRASGYVPDDAVAAEIALSLLAQWGHESARGANEFNFNLGGWRARKGDTYFTARDVQTTNSPSYRWTAYPELVTAITDQVMRLIKTFPRAAKLLLVDPKSSRWVEQLGHDGYYQAPPSGYARAWAMHRAELKPVVAP
jgi:hypothetical protein